MFYRRSGRPHTHFELDRTQIRTKRHKQDESWGDTGLSPFLGFVETQEVILTSHNNENVLHTEVIFDVLFLKCFSGHATSCVRSKHSPPFSVNPCSQESQSSYRGPPQVWQARWQRSQSLVSSSAKKPVPHCSTHSPSIDTQLYMIVIILMMIWSNRWGCILWGTQLITTFSLKCFMVKWHWKPELSKKLLKYYQVHRIRLRTSSTGTCHSSHSFCLHMEHMSWCCSHRGSDLDRPDGSLRLTWQTDWLSQHED